MSKLTVEHQILIAMRKTLGAIVRDVTPAPGQRHPLSAATVEDIRQCFTLIAAREKELADEQGRCQERPYYADEHRASTVVPITSIGKKRHAD